MPVMHKLEALRILETKLKSVEEERQAELADNENLRDPIDAKAEARALSAIFEYLKSCKIAPSNSLLRIFKRYLPREARIRSHPNNSIPFAAELSGSIVSELQADLTTSERPLLLSEPRGIAS